MRKMILAVLATAALAGVAACGESAADKTAEKQADALEAQAAATPNEGQEKALNAQADRVEQQAGNADGGMTTANTPNTSPSTGGMAPGAPAPAH
ncbi:hypothetical protein BH10PSE2_BH10PSE2_21500 [soil metagenome]